jgi:signal peptidase I
MLFRRKHAASQASASTGAKKSPPARRSARKVLKEWIMAFALVAAISIPIRSSIADWNDVPSGSMRPTILEGDRIYVNKLAYGLRIPFTTKWLARWDEPRRGEIVTMKSPADGIRLVKRVVGLPGDRISMRGNRLIINGTPSEYRITDRDRTLSLPGGTHALTLAPGELSPNTFPEVTVPEGHYFMMGDNRDMSRDSRMIGTVPLRSIYGRCGYVALSLDPENYYLPRWSRWFSELR